MKAFSERSRRSEQVPDDARRPVWLEATESFFKKLNRVAKQCEISRYEALSKGLDALVREAQIRNSALNRNIKKNSLARLESGPLRTGSPRRIGARKKDKKWRCQELAGCSCAVLRDTDHWLDRNRLFVRKRSRRSLAPSANHGLQRVYG